MKRLVLLIGLLLPSLAYSAPHPSFKVTNEMIYQKLIDIEQRQAIFDERFKQIDNRFEQIDKRFEDMNKRFEELREDMNKRFEMVDKRFEELREDMNKRFEMVDKRFEQLYTFLWIITGIFTAIMVGAFGFAYWDRRTIIAEAKRRTLEELERDAKPERLRKLLNVAREFARENEKFREILKKEGLL
jgi:nitrate reductase NapE component